MHTHDRTFGDRFAIGRVTNTTREGDVTRFEQPGWSTLRRVDLIGRNLTQIWVLPQHIWDVTAVMETAARHVYPGSDQAREYDSLDDAKEAIARHRRTVAVAA